jgi:pimeloyl-ACP methyl ester carboxylesterase/DNA-binding winged helix-turn-helix (wHTH) protein
MASGVYAFGPFRLEVGERRLLRDGEPLPLTGKAFDTLRLLVEGAGTLLKQEWLIDRLWPDVVVEQNNLQYNVSLVRKALAGAPGIEIQTVRGQGYRLVADVHPAADTAPAAGAAREMQRMHFAKGHDATRLAWASLGEGPPLVKAANWLSHLEMDWQGPIWTHWLELLSRGRRLIRYDARGNGLSEWAPPSITFEDFVADLGTIFEAAGIERAPILGISQGASVAVAYAARNPERVSALILIGGCARGWRVKGSARLRERFEALMALMRQGWGGNNAAFRQIFTTAFFPGASKEDAEWFNELQRQTASPDNAAAILSALGEVDVRSDLAKVRAPTLVLHSRSDAVVPMQDGVEVASGIPGARFVPVESGNHVWLAGEPAWKRFARELEQFLGDARP